MDVVHQDWTNLRGFEITPQQLSKPPILLSHSNCGDHAILECLILYT